jgi:surface polysaccharide O-acyltransferase-like enzyme
LREIDDRVRAVRERNSAMDNLRGLSALAVVVLHITADPLLESCCQGWLLPFYIAANVGARFAVPSFMLLSGAGLTLTAAATGERQSYLSFLARRLSKVVPAYVGWSLIYILWQAPSPGSLSSQRLLSDLLHGQAAYHLYFVPLLVILYLLHPVLDWLAQRGVRAALFCVIAWTRGTWLAWLNLPELEWLLVELIPLSFAGYFVAGSWLVRHSTLVGGRAATSAPIDVGSRVSWLSRVQSLAPWCTAALWLLMVKITFEISTARKDIDAGLDTIEPLLWPYTLGVVATVLGRAPSHGAFTRALRFVSSESYGVYLCHPFALDLVSRALAPLGYAPSSPSYVVLGLLLGLPLSLLLSMLTRALGTAVRSRLPQLLPQTP